MIFESLKTAGNEEQMSNIFKRVKKIEMDTAGLLEVLLNIKFDNSLIVREDDGKEYVEVCKAWDDHWKNGEKNGIAIGIEQGIEQTIFRLVLIKVKKNYTLDMIADDLEEDVEVIRPIYEAAKMQLS